MAGASRPSRPNFEAPAHEVALDIIALAATLLFAHGQTTERTVVTAERLRGALGVPARVLPDWDKLTVELEGTSLSKIVATKPLGMDMNRVLAITAIVDRLCDGALRADEARPALLSAGNLPPVSTLRFTSFAAIGAAALGVIFGALDITSLMLIAASAALGALVRRWVSGFEQKPFHPAALRCLHRRHRGSRLRHQLASADRNRPRRILSLHGAGAWSASSQRRDRSRPHADRTWHRSPDLCRHHRAYDLLRSPVGPYRRRRSNPGRGAVRARAVRG
jgi:hypothetical protein